MTPQLKAGVAKVTSIDQLDILAAPFKAGSKLSLAAKAIEAGLQEAAFDLLEDRRAVRLKSLVNAQIPGRSDEKVLENGIVQILAEHIAHHEATEQEVARLEAATDMTVTSTKAKETKAAIAKKKDERVDETKYDEYVNFKSRVSYIKPHQLMAINRGEKNKVLSVKVEAGTHFCKAIEDFCKRRFIHGFAGGIGRNGEFRIKLIQNAISEGYKRFGEKTKHFLPVKLVLHVQFCFQF